jgi:hypothetical protein
MRFLLAGASALLLAGCGGEEYPVPAAQAFDTLASVGTPSALSPLPVGIEMVDVEFDAVPDHNAVKWKFTHEGDDLGTIVARVDPNGDAASKVTVYYADGTAPGEKWRNEKVRGLLERQVQRLVVEAVDAKFEKRPFDQQVRLSVTKETALASVGAMMKDMDASLEEEIARRDEIERESKSRAAIRSASSTKPMTDLSKFN